MGAKGEMLLDAGVMVFRTLFFLVIPRLNELLPLVIREEVKLEEVVTRCIERFA